MKINHAACPVLFAGLLLILLNSCSKSEENTTPWVSNKNILFNPDLTYGTMADIDGNIYKTIQIGTQAWMAENLKTMKYKDGTAIPLVTDETAWGNLTTPAYCWYKNDSATYKANYGALYNWYSINAGKLCPTGWHVPTDTEWKILTTYLGGTDEGIVTIAGGKLKETGTTHWESPNTGATNESGFTALPGGSRSSGGSFDRDSIDGRWWSFTGDNSYSNEYAWYRNMGYDYNAVGESSGEKVSGFSVRCVKD